MLRVQEMATRLVDSFCCCRGVGWGVCVRMGAVQHNEIIFSQHFVCVCVCVADEFLVYVRDLLMLYVCQHKI